MSRRSLYACEIPWARDKDGPWSQVSMRPFLAGLCELHGVRLLYRTFTRAAELNALLSREMIPADNAQRVIVYINAHGFGSRLGTETGRNINIGPIANRMASHVEGIWVGACGTCQRE